MLSYIAASTAKQIDVRLYELGFTRSLLIELAGQSVAYSILSVYPPTQFPNACIFIGPGNNGLDGLVTARYLSQLDYLKVQVFTFKNDRIEECRRLFLNLAKNFGVQVIEINEAEQRAEISKVHEASFVVDAIFGFGFHSGEIKCPYDVFISSMVNCRRPIISIDVPSGWKIDAEEQEAPLFIPSMVVSLTLPKICMKSFKGIHYIGGAFIPKVLKQEMRDLQFPHFEDSLFLRL